jgi:hypothetical protein
MYIISIPTGTFSGKLPIFHIQENAIDWARSFTPKVVIMSTLDSN